VVASNVWGQLRRRHYNGNKLDEELLDLTHRVKDGEKDRYSIGRSKKADILVPDDKKISAIHCLIYCDYSQARLRFIVEVIKFIPLFILLHI